jgi:2-polyprenyl-3-methyl-5-hydroxy-6-metoxy-1,4-benzoquinol methylase
LLLYKTSPNILTWLDRYLQWRRFRKALKYVPNDAVILDIGCHQGEFLLKASGKILSGTGIDPNCENRWLSSKIDLIKGRFPDAVPKGKTYSCINMLAVLEHIPAGQQPGFLQDCFNLLDKGGLLILTIPDEKVDKILHRLKKMRLISGMNLEEHHGYDAFDTLPLGAKAGFRLLVFEQFEMGYNNLFVFLKP